MIDIEKIIKGIESCLSPHDPDCDLCPYDSIDLRCRAKLRDDIMILLKEREPIAPIIEQDMNEYTSDIEEVYFCGVCRYKVYKSEKYCANCGRKIKWDD